MTDYDKVKEELIAITFEKIEKERNNIIKAYKDGFEDIINKISKDITDTAIEKMPKEFKLASDNDVIEGYEIMKEGISKTILLMLIKAQKRTNQ